MTFKLISILLCSYDLLILDIGSRVLDLLLYSLVAQLVENLPAMQEALVQFLGWEDLLEMG